MKEEQTINRLPENWNEVQLGKACEKISLNGRNIKQKDYLPKGKYPVVDQGQDLVGGYFNDEELVIPNEPPYVIFGDHTRVKKYITFKFIAGADGVKVLKPSIDFDPKFFFYSLYTINIPDKGYARHFQFLEKAIIPLPPKNVQKQIVSKIEELFSELDKGIEELKKAQQQLKVYRQAVLKWAFEGRLTNEWREKQNQRPTAVDLLAKIRNRKANGKKPKELSALDPQELEELYCLPNGWHWEKNERYLFEVKDGTHDSPKYLSKGIPFVTQKNIREDGLDFTNVQYISEDDHKKFYQRSNVAKGDILISMIGHNRGMTAMVNTDIAFSIKNVGLFKLYSDLHCLKFSYYYYQSKIGLNLILKKSKGGAQPFIGLTELRNWPVIVCSTEEQKQIVKEIESRLSTCDKIEETIISTLKQAEALRQKILKKAFEGKLNVPN